MDEKGRADAFLVCLSSSSVAFDYYCFPLQRLIVAISSSTNEKILLHDIDTPAAIRFRHFVHDCFEV